MKNDSFLSNLKFDIPAGMVVFLVAVPLCLGIALASGAPLYSGMIAGVVGGIVVTLFSNSRFSVSGPAAGLSAIVLSSVLKLGSYESFLLAVVFAGIFQLLFAYLRGGYISNYIPSNVIKGMLAAIGIIIILKQIPHAVGYDRDIEGDFSFFQSDGENTFSELLNLLNRFNAGAALLAILSFAILIVWERPFFKKHTWLPGPLVAVVISIILNEVFIATGSVLVVSPAHMVSIPVPRNFTEFLFQFTFPDFSAIGNKDIYVVAFTIAAVASIETLLCIDAVDKLDPDKRHTSPNRELKAQGIGNIVSGLIGGLPITAVIVRSSANINANAKTSASSFFHGVAILLSIAFIPGLLNKIPLASLAAILILVGYKLVDPSLFREMFKKGRQQWGPFLVTVIAIVFTDLLTGVVIGLAVSAIEILRRNVKNPYYFHRVQNKESELIKIEFGQEISFLNKANIIEMLEELPANSSVVIDAAETEYIDFDVLEVIKQFRDIKAPGKKINLMLVGFKDTYSIPDNKPGDSGNSLINMLMGIISKAPQKVEEVNGKSDLDKITPALALNMLQEGNFRFLSNFRVKRNLLKQINETKEGQYPFAAILSCIDSRTSAELVFDQGLGDVFSIRIAGNIVNEDILGSMEFACKVAGSKIIVVLGHNKCGAVKGACDHVQMGNLSALINKLKPAVDAENVTKENRTSSNYVFVENVAQHNVKLTVKKILEKSPILKEMIDNGEVGIIGAMYDIETGKVEFYESEAIINSKPSQSQLSLV